MRIRSLCAALLSLALLMVLPLVTVANATKASAATPTPTPPPLRFFSYNLCGGSTWAGGTYCTQPGEVVTRAAYVSSEATAWNSDLLFLTEICKSQFDGIQSDLGPSGYHGAYVETYATESQCALHGGTSQSEGVALFSKGADPAPSAQAIYLGEHAGAEAVKMVCADTTLQGRAIKACTYHPSAAPDTTECPDYPSTAANCLGTSQQRQAEVARKTVEPWIAAGIPVVVGGDFNASPTDPSMDSFYDFGSGFGQFTEVDETDKTQFGSICPQSADRCRTGKYTYDLTKTDQSKIDYVFLSSKDFTSPYAATPNRNDAISDHGDLMGAAAWAGCTDPANTSAQSQTPCSGDTTSSIRGDFNGDGKDDLATLYNDGNGVTGLSVWLSDGKGGFAAPALWWRSRLGSFDWTASKAVIGDFNGDGKADVGVLYNYGKNPDGTNHTGLLTFLSTGTGFAAPVEVWDSVNGGTTSWDWNASTVVAGDFNADGKADIGVLYNYGQNADGTNHTGLWTFTSTGTGFANPVEPWDSGSGSWKWSSSKVVAGDFNGDGKADVGVLYNYGKNPDGSNHTGLWTFTSTGTGFAAPTEPWDSLNSGSGSWNWSSSKVVAGDFNGDGKADIGVLYNYGQNANGQNDTGLLTFTSTGTGFTAPAKPWDSIDNGTGSWNWNASKVVAGDFNGDGRTDVGVLYNQYDFTSAWWTFTAAPGGAFPGPAKVWNSSTDGFDCNQNNSFNLAGNFSGTGRSDLAMICNYPADSAGNKPVGIWTLASTNGGFTSPVAAYGGGTGAGSLDLAAAKVVTGDFNGDGKTDVGVLYNYGKNPDGTNHTGLLTFLSTGTGFAAPVEVWDSVNGGTTSWDWNASTVVAGDFNGDGKADIGVLYNYGQNANGTNHTGLWTFTSTGTGFANPVEPWDSGSGSWNWSSSKVVAGDFNSDGKADIGVLYNYGQNANGQNDTGLLTFTSTGTGFTAPAKPWDSLTNGTGSWNWHASTPVAGDFNGDGKTDLGVLYSYYEGSGDKSTHVGLWTFTSTGTSFANPTKPWDAGTGTTVGNWPNAVLPSQIPPCSLNPNCTPNASALGTRLAQEIAEPQVVVGDFNHDGKADLATAYGGGHSSTNAFVLATTTNGFNPPDAVWTSNIEWARASAL